MKKPEERVLLDEKPHWTDEITKGPEEIQVGKWKAKLSTLAVIATATLAALVGMAIYKPPYYGYLIASGTGVIFGLLVRYAPWQKTKYG